MKPRNKELSVRTMRQQPLLLLVLIAAFSIPSPVLPADKNKDDGKSDHLKSALAALARLDFQGEYPVVAVWVAREALERVEKDEARLIAEMLSGGLLIVAGRMDALKGLLDKDKGQNAGVEKPGKPMPLDIKEAHLSDDNGVTVKTGKSSAVDFLMELLRPSLEEAGIPEGVQLLWFPLKSGGQRLNLASAKELTLTLRGVGADERNFTWKLPVDFEGIAKCAQCQTPLRKEWEYCPKCGRKR